MFVSLSLIAKNFQFGCSQQFLSIEKVDVLDEKLCE